MVTQYQVFNEVTFQSMRYEDPRVEDNLFSTGVLRIHAGYGIYIKPEPPDNTSEIVYEIFKLKGRYGNNLVSYVLLDVSPLSSYFLAKDLTFCQKFVKAFMECSPPGKTLKFWRDEPSVEFQGIYKVSLEKPLGANECLSLIQDYCNKMSGEVTDHSQWILVGADDCLGPYKTQEEAKEVWRRARAGYFAIKELKNL
jgi:hypothetical protein